MSSMVCATCRKLIALGATAYRCSVASCNAGRMKLRFCSILCWEKHVPTARHRNASWIAEDKGGSESSEAARHEVASGEVDSSEAVSSEAGAEGVEVVGVEVSGGAPGIAIARPDGD